MDEKTLKALVTAICAASAVAVVVLILDMGIKRAILGEANRFHSILEVIENETGRAARMGVPSGVHSGGSVDLHAGMAPEIVAEPRPDASERIDAGPFGRFDPAGGDDNE